MLLLRAFPLFIILGLMLHAPCGATSQSTPPDLKGSSNSLQVAVSNTLQLPTTLAVYDREAVNGSIVDLSLPPAMAGQQRLAPGPLDGPSQDLAVDELGEEGGDDLVVDPETLEDTEILTDEQAIPPDDEGESVLVQEVTYDFPVVENQKVAYFVNYFTTDPGRKVFARWLERSTRYLPYMREVFAAEGLPQDLVYLSIVESGLNPKAYSWAHASGPWQFIPGTGKIFGLNNDYWWDERRNFEKSTLAAARYLKDLYTLFDGDWYLAVSSYNAGPGKVLNAIRQTGSRDFWVISRSRHLKEETKNYLPKLLAVLLIAKQPEKYGFIELNYQEPLVTERATVPAPTDLAVIARLTDTTYEQIKSLNPEIKRWCTPPQTENYQINLPLGTKEIFELAYAELPPEERTNYEYYKVAKGETLKEIAKRKNVSVDEILAVNSIANAKTIRPGRGLVLPLRPGVLPIPPEDLREDPIVAKLAGSRTYKVKKGDSLWKISRKTGISEVNLRTWNRLTAKSKLKIGQQLILGPSKAKGKAPAVAAKKVEKKSSNQTKMQTAKRKTPEKAAKVVHKVRKGDSLDKIARQYDVRVTDIRNWNGLPQRHVLQPGDHLTIRVQGRRGG